MFCKKSFSHILYPLSKLLRPVLNYSVLSNFFTRLNTIGEFNVDSKAECDQVNLAHETKINNRQCPLSSVQVKVVKSVRASEHSSCVTPWRFHDDISYTTYELSRWQARTKRHERRQTDAVQYREHNAVSVSRVVIIACQRQCESPVVAYESVVVHRSDRCQVFRDVHTCSLYWPTVHDYENVRNVKISQSVGTGLHVKSKKNKVMSPG